jgi:hypothetical protein
MLIREELEQDIPGTTNVNEIWRCLIFRAGIDQDR